MSGKAQIPAGAPWSVRRERLRRRLLALFLVVEAAAVSRAIARVAERSAVVIDLPHRGEP